MDSTILYIVPFISYNIMYVPLPIYTLKPYHYKYLKVYTTLVASTHKHYEQV